MTINDLEPRIDPFWRGLVCGISLTLGGVLWIFLLNR